jgi:hypothetical protein
MAKYIVGLVLVVLVVAVLYSQCGGEDGLNAAADSGSSTTAELSQVFRDRTYRLRYPANWRLEDHSKAQKLIRADLISPSGDAGAQVRVQTISPGANREAFVDTYVARFISDMKGRWGGEIKVVDRVASRADLIAVSLTHHRRDGQAWFFKEHLWFSDGQVVILQSGTRLANRDRDEPILDAIAATLQR